MLVPLPLLLLHDAAAAAAPGTVTAAAAVAAPAAAPSPAPAAAPSPAPAAVEDHISVISATLLTGLLYSAILQRSLVASCVKDEEMLNPYHFVPLGHRKLG